MSKGFRRSTAIYRRLLEFMWPYRLRLLIAIICSIVFGSSQFLVIKLIRPLFDGIILDQQPETIRTLPWLILGLYLFRGGISYTQMYMVQYVGHRTIMDIRNRLFGHLTHMSMTFFKTQDTGVMVSRVTNDARLVQAGVSATLRELLINTFEILALSVWIFVVSLKLAVVGFVLLPISLYPLIRFARKLRVASHLTQERMADMSSVLVETLFGIQMVQAFNLEEQQQKRFHRESRGYFNAAMRAARVQALSPPLMEFIGALAVAAIVGFGGYLMHQGEISPAQFGQFVAALTMLYKPVKTLSRANHALQQAITAGQRLFLVLDDQRRVAETAGAAPMETFQERVLFESVSFSYEDDIILDDVDLTARRGERVALVGSSGAGKTTLVNLLPRFHDPSAGRILIDGRDIRGIDLKSLRDRIGIVSQETVLFNTSVAENIGFGRPGATPEEIQIAARDAYAHDFIQRLPEGYDTVIGERGTRLSGGERQRIAIARALLKDPPILILDEATSALDTESESIIQKALERLVANRTTFVIAHRLSTVQRVNRIYVLEKGRVVESGSHRELLKRNGRYRALYDLQFSQDLPPVEDPEEP